MKREFLSTKRQRDHAEKKISDIERLEELGWVQWPSTQWPNGDGWHESGKFYTYNTADAIALEALRGNIKRGRKAK